VPRKSIIVLIANKGISISQKNICFYLDLPSNSGISWGSANRGPRTEWSVTTPHDRPMPADKGGKKIFLFVQLFIHQMDEKCILKTQDQS